MMLATGRFVLLSLLTLFLTACNGSDNSGSQEMAKESDPLQQQLMAQLQEVEQQIQYAAQTLYIDSYLYVNDMPIVIDDGGEPGYNRFIAIIRLNTLEGSVLVNSITNAKLYIVQNESVLWESVVEASPEIHELDSGLEVVFRNGPSSLRNQVVDAILEFESQGTQYRVMDKAKTVNVVF